MHAKEQRHQRVCVQGNGTGQGQEQGTHRQSLSSTCRRRPVWACRWEQLCFNVGRQPPKGADSLPNGSAPISLLYLGPMKCSVITAVITPQWWKPEMPRILRKLHVSVITNINYLCPHSRLERELPEGRDCAFYILQSLFCTWHGVAAQQGLRFRELWYGYLRWWGNTHDLCLKNRVRFH